MRFIEQQCIRTGYPSEEKNAQESDMAFFGDGAKLFVIKQPLTDSRSANWDTSLSSCCLASQHIYLDSNLLVGSFKYYLGRL